MRLLISIDKIKRLLKIGVAREVHGPFAPTEKASQKCEAFFYLPDFVIVVYTLKSNPFAFFFSYFSWSNW